MTRRGLFVGMLATLGGLLVPRADAAIFTSSQTAAYASGTNTAGSTANGATIDARTALLVRFAGSITNGVTAPTIAAQANLQWSPDNFTTTRTVQIATGSLTNSAVMNFQFEVWVPGGYTRVQITGNTAQSVTYAVSSATVSSIQ